jgi:hypothetical protein
VSTEYEGLRDAYTRATYRRGQLPLLTAGEPYEAIYNAQTTAETALNAYVTGLQEQVEALTLALNAMVHVDVTGAVSYVTANGIPMQMPRPIAKKVRAALSATQGGK